MMTDPIADMLTRIRNAVTIERPFVDIPSSNIKVGIAGALKREGFIWDHEVVEEGGFRTLRITLKYGPNGERLIQHLKRDSSPGCRRYLAVRDLKPVLQGLGVRILSTNKGVLSNREAKTQGVGGEVLCTVW